jgi:exodeoxyribonuclease VII large subunit
VSEITARIKSLLEEEVGNLWVAGEISNLRRPRSGHIYFTLKDEGATLPAVLFRRSADRLGFELEDGLEIVVFGAFTVYAPRGAYQIIVEHAEPRGRGALQLAFEKCKARLAAEGLFDPDLKKPLPFLPRRIGLVTSASGAAVHDIISVILRRFPAPHLTLLPVRVQGPEAAGEIAAAIEAFNRFNDVDVLIVGRGGGSLEDLWPFNEEVVARAIAASRIPVISAVGHEIDFTIADFVADRRALTPSEAGEIVLPPMEELLATLDGYAERLPAALLGRVRRNREILDSLAERISPDRASRRLTEKAQRLDDLIMRLESAARRAAGSRRDRLRALKQMLGGLNPRNVLARGYSYTCLADGGPALRKARDLHLGIRVRTWLHEGSFASTVTDTSEDPP